MTERLKQIPLQLLKIWNKYTSKQKTIIISVICAVFFAFILLVWIMGRTKFEKLSTYDSQKDASTVAGIFKR